MTTTPREVPVREAEIEHIAAVLAHPAILRVADDDPDADALVVAAALYDAGLRSQQYLDGLVAALEGVIGALDYDWLPPSAKREWDQARLILEGARATDDEGQR